VDLRGGEAVFHAAYARATTDRFDLEPVTVEKGHRDREAVRPLDFEDLGDLRFGLAAGRLLSGRLHAACGARDQ